MKTGLVQAGCVLQQRVESVDSRRGLAAALPGLAAAWRALLGRAGLTPGECRGASLAFPSLVDPTRGRILAQYGKYPDAMDLDLRTWARAEFGLDLAMENDARMAAIGEWRHGAGRGCDNLVMVTLGTGLGTCAIMEGRVVQGVHHQAGVLGGHLTVRYGGRPCTCGNLGCAEAEASSARLPEIVPEQLAGADSLDYAQIFARARSGQPEARAVLDHSLLVWSALVVNLIHAYDPERVILGGGIMGSAEVILPAVCRYADQHAHTPWGRVEITASQLGESAALVAGEWLLDNQFPASRHA